MVMSPRLTLLCFLLLLPSGARGEQPSAPKTPAGLAPCVKPLLPPKGFTRQAGERLTYGLEILGIKLGVARFEIKRRGTFQGKPVTEYGLNVDAVSLANWLIEVDGSAAAIIADGETSPLQAASRYVFRHDREQEFQTYSLQGRRVVSKRNRNGKQTVQRKDFPSPVLDFLTGFYLLRRIPKAEAGCAIVYSGHKTFTLWIHPEATEDLNTRIGLEPSVRYRITYGSDRDRTIKTVKIWFSDDARRLPLRIEGTTRLQPVATLRSYRPPPL